LICLPGKPPSAPSVTRLLLDPKISVEGFLQAIAEIASVRAQEQAAVAALVTTVGIRKARLNALEEHLLKKYEAKLGAEEQVWQESLEIPSSGKEDFPRPSGSSTKKGRKK